MDLKCCHFKELQRVDVAYGENPQADFSWS